MPEGASKTLAQHYEKENELLQSQDHVDLFNMPAEIHEDVTQEELA